MSNTDTIRAWKDEAFRESLGGQAIQENPAGQIELFDASFRDFRENLKQGQAEVLFSGTCNLTCTENFARENSDAFMCTENFASEGAGY